MNKKQKLKKNNLKLFLTLIFFLVFTSVLFINNLSDLLEKYNVIYPIEIITWFGLIGSALYGIWLAVNRRNLV